MKRVWARAATATALFTAELLHGVFVSLCLSGQKERKMPATRSRVRKTALPALIFNLLSLIMFYFKSC